LFCENLGILSRMREVSQKKLCRNITYADA
jgi:hypothetical protein